MNTLLTTFTAILVSSTPNLEATYWDCDYRGTITMLSFDEAAYCSKVFEELKKEKFSGNWADFYQWWKENKDREYNKRKKSV
jgi:hypothetical protein